MFVSHWWIYHKVFFFTVSFLDVTDFHMQFVYQPHKETFPPGMCVSSLFISFKILQITQLTVNHSAILWSQLRNVTSFLSTWRPPCGPMSFAPMAASSRMDRGTITCQKLSPIGRFSGWNLHGFAHLYYEYPSKYFKNVYTTVRNV